VRYAGIDLSITGTGIALSDGSLYKVGYDGITRLSIHEQMLTLDNLTARIVHKVPVETQLVCIEGLDMANSYGAQIERSVLWWQVIVGLADRTTVAVAPSGVVKLFAAGKGNATKPEMIAAVKRIWPQFEVGRDHNLADAAAMCALAASYAGNPLPTPIKLSDKQQAAPGRARLIVEPPPTKQVRRRPAVRPLPDPASK
jgi:crossover junction endodeoxyribonuclease RuvC